MVTLVFAAFLLLAATIALIDWRRGWYLAILCGVLQDPARKMTAGTPVAMTFSIVLIYLLVLVSSHATLRRNFSDLAKRFGPLYLAGTVFMMFLAVAAANGLMTYGLASWKAPALSLVIYTIPIPALLLGYSFFRRDEDLVPLLIFYSAITSLALVGVLLEYKGIRWQALGLVAAADGATIRYLPGIQIRMLSGFYRAPDIMAWHAATLTMIGITMSVRARSLRSAWPWMAVSAWGLVACFLSGRRKALYMVVVFAIIFVWRYARRLRASQAISIAALGILLALVVNNIASSEETDVYLRGAVTTQSELLQRLEGGFRGTIEQFGFLGAGLGTATQGTQHFGTGAFGWQEGGLGKLTIELGVPGVLAAVFLLLVLLNFFLKITRAADEPGTSQLIRCALMAMAIANVGNFLVSAQAYSDPVLTLLASFFVGCLLATAAAEWRLMTASQALHAPARPLRSATA